ncbi:hypothetical protein [Nitrospira defluvii]|uniref:Uncharacterized protein n=1 Tax=Nitrospira defluvii TaxID=330214 RepID=A0ABM8S9C0_9BACT|nr:hypothetical protein [Nitrospira defluvii]CAE6795794.1 hypothetical protein NSPZN2_70084 [Nitrospira defluvii]
MTLPCQAMMCGALPAKHIYPFSNDVDGQEHEAPTEREDQEQANPTT